MSPPPSLRRYACVALLTLLACGEASTEEAPVDGSTADGGES